MSLPKSELSEILNAMGNVLTRLVDRVENDHEFQPYERRAILNTMYEKMCGVQMQEILDDANKSHNLVPKRGDGAVNDAYTGVPGEITVDMDAKTVRVHDGETTGGVAMARAMDTIGDWVVESQLPTAENNYTWYRKYKSGWVEMGGCITNQNDGQVHITYLPICMQDTSYTYNDYFINISAYINNAWQIKDHPNILTTKNTNSFSRYFPDNVQTIYWQVSGISAEQ